MTINLSDNTPRVSYTVSEGATQTAFAVPFEFFADADLNFYVDGTKKTLTTHYTTSANAQNNAVHVSGTTGFIHTTTGNTVTGATGGSTVIITRDIAFDRTTDFPASGSFAIGTLNTELDRLTAIVSDLNDISTRSVRLKDFDEAQSLELPLKDDRKGKVLGFNATTGVAEAGPNITAVQSLADVTTSINLLGTSAVVEDMGLLATSAVIEDMSLLATSANVTAMGLLGTSAVVTDMGLLGTSAVITDMDLLATSANVTAMGHLGTSANVTAMGLLGTSAVVTDMGLLGTSANVTAMGHLGTSANVTAMGLLGTSDVVADMALLGTSDVVADMALLGTSDVVADMALLATSAVIEDMGLLATSANVTAMGHLGTSANVTAMGLLGTSAVVEDMGFLGTSANVTAMGLLGTSDAVSDMNTLAAISTDISSLANSLEKTFTVTVVNDSGNKFALAVGGVSLGNAPTIEMFRGNKYIFDQSDSSNSGHPLAFKDGSGNAWTSGVTVTGTAGSSGAKVEFEVPSTAPDSMRYYCTQHGNSMGNTITVSNSNISIVAANIDNVNSFANQYRIGSSDPTSSLDEGDLFYNTSSDQLKIYNGSSWVAGVLAGSGFAATSNNLSDLGNASTALSNLGGMPLAGGTFTGDVTVKTSDGAILKLQTSDTSVGDGDVIGAIEFAAPDESDGTDAVATAASIVAEADATFAADNNKTDLVIKLGKSEAATERGRFKHEGGLTITGYDTDANPDPALALMRSTSSPADNDFIGNIYFQGKNSADEDITYAAILAVTNDVTDGTEDGKLIFRVADGGNQAWSGSANNLITLTPDTIAFDASSGTSFGGHDISSIGNIVISNGGNIGSSSDTDALAISSGGVVNFTQQPTVSSAAVKVAGKETIWIPAAAMYPESTNGCAALAQVELSNGPELKCLDFDPSSDEHAQFTVAFPKSWNEGTITFSAYFTVSGTNTGTVSWALSGVSLSDNGDINTSFGTAEAPTAKAHSGTSGDLNITAESGNITIAGSPAAEDLCFFRIMRDVSADDQSGDARLLGIKLFYTTDAANDA